MSKEITAERASSLGSTIAVIGSVLIAVGFAWLIADNWHQFPSIVKVIILLILTSASIIGGVIFRNYDYDRIGSSLIVLGSLLFTLTIFLIAQIYNLASGMQGNAWLLLICWIGVILIAYSLDSSSSLIIGMSEFLIWIMFQHWAFAESARNYSTFGPMALSYLLVGVLFYGLSLIHKSREHKFYRVYMWWTLFYITVYAFTFTFLRLIPSIWPTGITMSSSTLVFLIVLFLFSLISFVSGIIVSLSSGKTTVREIGIFSVTIILLFILILSSAIVSSQVGTCYMKNCGEFNTQQSCLNSNAGYNGRGCLWEENQCMEKSCYVLKSEKSCNSAKIEDQICKWENNYCAAVDCAVLSREDQCLLNGNLKCIWTGPHQDSSKNCPTAGVGGNIGDALSFSGTQYVSVDNFNQILDSFSVSVWVYPEEYPSISSTIMGTGYNSFLIDMDPQGKINVGLGFSEYNHQMIEGSQKQIGLNRWSNIIFVYDSHNSILELWVNGEKYSSDPLSETLGGDKYDKLVIGSELLGTGEVRLEKGFKGKIDEVSAWDHALRSNEVKDIYTKTKTPEEITGNTLSLHFNEISGSTIFEDSSPLKNYAKCELLSKGAQSLTYCQTNFSAMNSQLNKPSDLCTSQSNNRKSCLSSESCSWRGGELGYGYYGQSTSIPFSLWALWIFANVIFIILILGIIAYGTMNGSQKIVNLGILFFVIDLISRYIGFWIDYYRSSIAILSILGGVLLIVGGWLIEKWRKNLLEQIQTRESS